MSKRFLSGINVTGTATFNTAVNAGVDTDKFLVLDAAGNVDFRTGDELRLDIGADVVSKVQHEVKLGETMTIGTPVYIGVDLNAGTNMTVYKATNATEAGSSKTIGLIASSGITNDLVQVVTEGLLAGLNTSTATKGDPVWLGVNGALLFGLANKPVAPAHMVFLGIVTRVQQNNGEIFVKVQNGFEMNEIHNYLQGSVQNNEVIVYESATSLYKPKSIPTILGYTPADDASVVRITGAQTVGGLKTFSASIVANIGVLLKNGAVSALNGYTAIGGSSSNGIELVFSPGGSTQSLLFQTSAAYSYTFPAATGTVALISDIPSLAGYVPNTRTLTINGTTYDLSANRSWTITTDASARSILRYVATANQTTFTISGGYTPGLTDVYRNGVKLDNSTDFTATNGTTIVLTNGASVNDVIEVYRYQTAFLANNALRVVTEFIATAGQTTFNVTYNSGLVDVFYNGSKLLSTEYTAGNGTSIILNFPCNVNDTLEVHAYSYTVGAFTGQAQLNGTGFVKVSGTTVSYDNSTYLTTSSASSTYATISSLSSYLPLTGGILTSTTRMDGSGGTTDPITMIFNTGINRLLTPVVRLFGATNTSSNYVELFGLLATQNRTINFPDASGTVALTSNLSSYLPLSGGIITGNVELNGGTGTRTFTIQSNTSGDAVLQILAAGSNGGNITYKRSTSEIVFNNNAVDALKIGGSGAATFSSNVTAASGLYNGYTSGLPPASGSATRGGLRLNNASNIALDFGTVAAGQAWLQVSDANNYASNFALLLNPNGGAVSIGTTNSSARLNVQASANFETATLGTATGTMGYLSANGLYGMYVGIGNSGNTWLQSQRNDGTNATYNLLLNPQGGLVGIGTTAPQNILHVNGGSDYNTMFSSSSNRSGWVIATPGTTNAAASALVLASDGSFRLGNASQYQIAMYTNNEVGIFGGGTERLRVTNGGQILTASQPAFMAYGNGNVTIDAAGTYIIYPSVHFNRGSHYNSSTGVFTVPVSGLYFFSWTAIGNTTNDVYRWYLRINNVNFLGDTQLRQDTAETGSAYADNGNRQVLANLTAGSTVRIWFSSDGGSQPYGVNATDNPYLNFMGYLIG